MLVSLDFERRSRADESLQIDDSTKEKTSGRFAGYNGEEFAW